MGNSQSIRVGSRYIRINSRAQYVVIIVIITLGFLTLSDLARCRLGPSSSIRMSEDGSSRGMGRAGGWKGITSIS